MRSVRLENLAHDFVFSIALCYICLNIISYNFYDLLLCCYLLLFIIILLFNLIYLLFMLLYNFWNSFIMLYSV